MAYVNYVREHMAFIERASDLNLNGNERTFWYALIHVANQRANGSDWPEDFISIPNKRLLALVPFSEKNIPALRNRLRQAGLIEFRSGERNKKAPEYKILYLTAELSTENPQNDDFYPNFKCNDSGKRMGNDRGKVIGNDRGNARDINVNLNVTHKLNEYADDADADEADQRAHTRMEDCVFQAFCRELGREPHPAELRNITLVAINCDVDPELVVQAIAKTAVMNARNPAAYAIEIIRRWSKNGMHTIYDLVDCGEM